MSSQSVVGERSPLLTDRSVVEVTLDEQENPKTWPESKKWLAAVLVSLYALVGPASAAMVVPILPGIRHDMHVTNDALAQTVLSVFVFSWCLGPLFIGPCSELFGRAAILNTAHCLFFIVNTLCAFVSNIWLFLALRFIAGFIGSGPLALGGGVIADLWDSDERGKSLAIYTLAPLLGPAIGPIVGGFVGQSLSWRWVFLVMSGFTFLTLAVGLFVLEETFAPILIKRKRLRLEMEAKHDTENVLTHQRNDRTAMLARLFKQDLRRPFIMIFTQPIVQAIALYFGYLWGLNYLTISTFLRLFTDVYHQRADIATLHYISIALGFVLGCQCAPLNDMIYRRLKKANGGVGKPEFRAYMMIPASVLVPIGLLFYGWTAQLRLHWILPDLGVVVYAFGQIICYQCINAYTLDCYPTYAASALGALTIMRCISGFLFPTIAPYLYDALDYGWTSTVLAGAAVVLGGVSPWVLKYKGPSWREMSPYATGDVKVDL